MQSALTKAYLKWPQVQAAVSPEAYVRTMVVNTFVSDRRRKSSQMELVRDAPPDSGHDSAETDVVQRAALLDVVKGLPPRQRAVLVLRYYEDLSEREIADTLGCSPGTVKSQAAAGLRSLRGKLNGSMSAHHGTGEGQ